MVTLLSGQTIARINPNGSWVESLTSENDQILFPLSELTDDNGEPKKRGGMHICLPNFGPGGDSGLPQHGFGRTGEWAIVETSDHAVTLELRGGSSDYSDLVSRLTYTLEPSLFSAELTLQNDGTEPLRVAPAFHPYFTLTESDTAITVNGASYQLDALAGTEFITADTVKMTTSNHSVQLSQLNLTTWAIWTDQLGSYVCVEPTAGGYRFLEAPSDDELLDPGRSARYTCKIAWS